MSSEKAWSHWSRFLRRLGAHPVLEPAAKVWTGVAAVDDVVDQQCNDRYHHTLSFGMDYRADCHHNASWTTCIDRMPLQLADGLVASLAGEAL